VFLGHFALGFAAKRTAPYTSLGTLFAASQLPDLLWPVFVLAGAEQVRIAPGATAFTPLDFTSYPWSHSLLLVAAWGLLFGGLYWFGTRNGRAAVVLGLLVVSHWVLDVVTHRPDMPLVPHGPEVGLGLWNSVPATIVVEGAMFAAGVWVYAHGTRPLTKTGRWALVSLVAFLSAIYVGNMAGPPPNITAIWIGGMLGGVILITWAAWIDRHRAR
jgi:hypothetical protein